MDRLKYSLLITSILLEVIGMIFLFINLKVAVVCFIGFAIFFLLLLYVFIKERINEKKGENEDDYRNY